MTRPMLVPSPDHPITIEPTGSRVLVRAGDHVVADTTRALTLQESTYPSVQYVPIADVDQTLLCPTPTSSYCPYKGECSYYSVVIADAEIADAVWEYREPYPAVAEIDGHVAFYPDRVEVVVG
jgi:uncharacterized protein (DUF427 family)